MAKRKLYIHVGPHKTGSSTIQRGLYANQKALEKIGYHYPKVAFTFHGHHSLVADIGGLKHFDPNLDGLNELLDFCQNNDGNIILSSERFGEIVRPEPFQKLKTSLDGDFDIQIITYLRRQDELLQSLCKTKAQFFNLRDSFNDWLPGAIADNKFLKYDEWLSVLEQVFGKPNLHVNIYDPKSDDLLFQLLRICGIDDFSNFKSQKRANISHSSLAFDLARHLFKHPFAERLRKAKDAPAKPQNVMSITTDFLITEGVDLSQSLYRPDSLKRVRERFRPHNRKTARRYFNRAQLFENPPRLKASRGKLTDQLTPDQILRLCGALIEMEQARAI